MRITKADTALVKQVNKAVIPFKIRRTRKGERRFRRGSFPWTIDGPCMKQHRTFFAGAEGAVAAAKYARDLYSAGLEHRTRYPFGATE